MSVASTMRNLANRLDTPGARWAGKERIPLKLYQLFERIKSAHRIGSILDVGANRGVYSIRASRCFPGVPIHAFEPLPACHERLVRLASGLPSLTVHKVAVGDRPGEIQMFENEYNESSSVLNMMDRHRQLWPHTEKATPVTVPMITLDQFTAANRLAEPIFLKIDVQGYELSVLRGAIETLRKVAVAVMEVNFEPLYQGQADFRELVDFMGDRGLRFIEFSDEMRVPAGGRLIYADAVFEAVSPTPPAP